MLLGMQETQSTNFSGNKCLYSSTLATPEDKSLLAEWKEYGLEVKRSTCWFWPSTKLLRWFWQITKLFESQFLYLNNDLSKGLVWVLQFLIPYFPLWKFSPIFHKSKMVPPAITWWGLTCHGPSNPASGLFPQNLLTIRSWVAWE